MRPVIYGAVPLAALCAAIASGHVPKVGFELRTFRKVSDAVSCDGKPLMLVDNSLEQLLIVLYAGREIDVPCIEPVLTHWSRWIVRDGSLLKS
ncbi:hypothetical protein SAMN04487782_3333 [Stenotrophomonas maltophilia]|nr:hypothetical protein SAMN04487782_3333 [Stenotrophomonas maltophilia]